MRIVAGTAKGRVLATPKSDDVIRPTADRVRQTIFNVLGQWCEGFDVLDLFAGTGALGLEALSRGAAKVVFVDSGREAQTLCAQNAATFKMSEQVEILPLTALPGIAKLGARGMKFDLVFSDPPYKMEASVTVLTALTTAGIVKPDGRVVIEYSKEETVPDVVGAFTRVDERQFGATSVSIFRLTDTPS